MPFASADRSAPAALEVRRGLRSPRTWAWLLTLAAALTLSATVAWQLLREWQQLLDEQHGRSELLARVLEDHATRSVEGVGLALSALSVTVSQRPSASKLADTPLEPLLTGQPHLRALAIVDADGRVLASSLPRDAGVHIDLAALGTPPRGTGEAMGRWVAGRSLADIAVDLPPSAVPARVGFVPQWRGAATRDNTRVWLVALLHADAIADHMRLTLRESAAAATLATYDGRVLASTGELAPGANVAALPVFAAHLPHDEHAFYVGAGSGPGEQAVAFRVSRSRPLVVIVERPMELLRAQWAQRSTRLLAVGGAALAVLLLLGALAARSLQARELARARASQAQAEVARRERELSTIARSVQELLFRTDERGVLTFVSSRWSAIGAADAVGSELALLAPAPDRPALRALFDGGGSGLRQAQATLGSGGRRFEIAVVPVREGERLLGFAGSAADVTERVQAQQRLADELAFSSLLLEQTPLPTSMLDAQGCYVRVNRAWEQFTGRSRDEVIGRPARSWLPPEEARQHEEVDRRLLAEGGRASYEVGFAHPDGSRHDLLLHKAAVPGPDGRPAYVLATFLDVSELRGAERATRAARDLAEEAARAKDEFVANISHELRTPLQSIIGFSELGSVRARGHERFAAMFDDIHAGGQRMLALVNDLLDVAKLDSAVGTLHLERTDLRPLLREVIAELDPLLTRHRLHVDADVSEAPLVAKIDPLRLQQVLRNVLANAIKFSPEGAAIDVLAEATPDAQIRIAVRDRGPGIPPAEIDRIFEAFVQSSRTKDGSGGTGLGLAICRKIVLAHGGTIHAENAPGGGSCFHVCLPSRGFADTMPLAAELGG